MAERVVRRLVPFVLVALAAGACGPASDPTPSVGEHARAVPLEGQANFRDIGGYQTADGRTVRWGEVYRSGRLDRLSDSDVDRVDSLGIRTVVNLLTPAEIEHEGPTACRKACGRSPFPSPAAMPKSSPRS